LEKQGAKLFGTKRRKRCKKKQQAEKGLGGRHTSASKKRSVHPREKLLREIAVGERRRKGEAGWGRGKGGEDVMPAGGSVASFYAEVMRDSKDSWASAGGGKKCPLELLMKKKI